MYCLAGYVLPRIAGQKGNRRSHILGLAQTTQWYLSLQSFSRRFQRPRHIRINKAGSDAVHGNRS